MAKSSTPNSSNSTYNVLSNNENLEGVRKQVIDGIKIDLLDTLKMDDIMVNRNELANDINDNRRDNFVGHPVIDKLKLNNSHPVVKEDDYKDILDEYDSLIAEKEANNWPDDHAEFNKKLRELDTRLAERVILDNGLAIQFKSGERFEDGKNAEEESKIAYENLNKMELNGIKKYEGKIDWIFEQKGETNYFIIKRKPEELALIKAALKAIDEVSAMKDEDIETLKAENKKNSDTITDLTQRIEELEKNKKIEDEKKQEEIAELKKKYEALEQGNQTEGTDTDGKNGESTTKKGTSTGTNNSPTNSEKTPAETIEQTSNEATKQPEKGYLTEEQIDKILDDKLKKYLAPLLEAQEKTTRKAPENKELNSKSRERSRESVETNPLYVSRKDIENSVLASRRDSDFPIGNVEIKGTYVKLEEFNFYEEIKQEYILAKGDSVKLAELDKKLAELIILCSPKDADAEHRYQIQLTEEEIVAGGLVVSQEFLARYGLAVDYFEYTNRIIEREYQERIETIKSIETEINELTTIIKELTTKVNIETSSSERILEEIREKKARLLVLIKRQKELLKTFRKGKKIAKEIDDDKHQNGELAFEFSDASGNLFYNECKTRKIKRKDGVKIPEIGGIDTAVDYVDDKGRILKLEPRYGSDDGEDTTLEGYRFIYTGKKQIFETIYGETRISLGKFDAGTKGELFKHYCDKNGIRRKDGKDINPNKFDEDFMNATYEKDGKELKLEFSEGGAIGGDDNTLNKYEFVYYEGKKERDDDEVGDKLYEIIQEQEALYLELEELEHQLMMTKTESVRKEIERKIKIIQTKLITINQKITEVTNITKRYKETVTLQKYAIIKVRKRTTIIPPIPTHPFEMTSVISDMGTDVFREKTSLKVEEELKAYYKSLGRWQVGSRLALFLGRGRRRKRMIRNEMNNMANTAFQTGAGYGALNEQSQNAADRHGHELVTGMEAINKITTVHNQQVDQLCKDYLNNIINDSQFQQQFNQIIANDANVQNALNGQSITHIGTNILLRLQEQKALNQLILDMDAQLAQYVATGNVVHMDNMRNYVSQFIKDYQKTPAFMANFEQFVKGDLNARNQLRRYLNHQRAVMQMQITNLRMNIDILNKGKSAYQIDNKDRETGKGSWKFKLGHFMDKHPRGTAIASTAISVGIGLGTGLIASPVVAGALSLGLFGGLVGTTNAVKKWTHHTKEQNTHEKNVATDYRNEQAKIQAWQNQALNGHGRRRYKAKRQLALYDQTTQENIKLSDQITEYITNLSSKVGPLTADENNFMRCNLIEGWARLKYYRQMGHNFLASEQVDKTEKDMKRLEKAVTLGLQKIGKTTNDIETNMNATNQLGTNITYAVIQNDLKASYDKSLIQFKRERRNLSLKYGFGTAIASIGVGAFFQRITHSGMWAGKDIAPTTTVTTKTGTEEFTLGGSELTGTSAGTVEEASKSAFSTVTSGDTVNILYGAGTDGTKVVSTFDPLTKKADVIAHINGLSGMSPANKAQFVDYINSMPILTDNATIPAQELLNGNLATMRQYETLERIADGLANSGKGAETLTLNFSPIGYTGPNTTAGAIAGMTPHTAAERFANGIIEIGHTEPGRKAVRRGRWFMGMPLFFNTFKDRKDTTDTTDQNWGRGRGQQPNQPQVNPNQPQVNPNQPQANPNQPRHP